MKITFRPFDWGEDADCAALAKWENDSEIRHLFAVFKDKVDYKRVSTVEHLKSVYVNPNRSKRRQNYMILADNTRVGECSLDFELPHMISAEPDTAWFGIVIGEAFARGKGIGEQAMLFLESEAQKLGAKRAELGVFEFNERAIKLYQKMGYKELKRIKNFTYWNDFMWSDVRMSKNFHST